MTQRKCLVSYCRKYVTIPEKYCEQHKGYKDKTYNKQIRYSKGSKEYNDFYQSKQWKQARRQHLLVHPLCEQCLRERRTVPATIVHHKIELKQNFSLALEPSNLESICQEHHNKEHKRSRTQF